MANYIVKKQSGELTYNDNVVVDVDVSNLSKDLTTTITGLSSEILKDTKDRIDTLNETVGENTDRIISLENNVITNENIDEKVSEKVQEKAEEIYNQISEERLSSIVVANNLQSFETKRLQFSDDFTAAQNNADKSVTIGLNATATTGIIKELQDSINAIGDVPLKSEIQEMNSQLSLDIVSEVGETLSERDEVINNNFQSLNSRVTNIEQNGVGGGSINVSDKMKFNELSVGNIVHSHYTVSVPTGDGDDSIETEYGKISLLSNYFYLKDHQSNNETLIGDAISAIAKFVVKQLVDGSDDSGGDSGGSEGGEGGDEIISNEELFEMISHNGELISDLSTFVRNTYPDLVDRLAEKITQGDIDPDIQANRILLEQLNNQLTAFQDSVDAVRAEYENLDADYIISEVRRIKDEINEQNAQDIQEISGSVQFLSSTIDDLSSGLSTIVNNIANENIGSIIENSYIGELNNRLNELADSITTLNNSMQEFISSIEKTENLERSVARLSSMMNIKSASIRYELRGEYLDDDQFPIKSVNKNYEWISTETYDFYPVNDLSVFDYTPGDLMLFGWTTDIENEQTVDYPLNSKITLSENQQLTLYPIITEMIIDDDIFVSDISHEFDSSGGHFEFTVDLMSDARPIITGYEDIPWLTVTLGETHHEGAPLYTTTVSVDAEANDSIDLRKCTLQICNRHHKLKITQQGQATEVNVNGFTFFNTEGGTGIIEVRPSSNSVSWTAELDPDDQDWIAIDKTSGVGSDDITYTVSEYPNPHPGTINSQDIRSCKITIGSNVIDIAQLYTDTDVNVDLNMSGEEEWSTSVFKRNLRGHGRLIITATDENQVIKVEPDPESEGLTVDFDDSQIGLTRIAEFYTGSEETTDSTQNILIKDQDDEILKRIKIFFFN